VGRTPPNGRSEVNQTCFVDRADRPDAPASSHPLSSSFESPPGREEDSYHREKQAPTAPSQLGLAQRRSGCYLDLEMFAGRKVSGLSQPVKLDRGFISHSEFDGEGTSAYRSPARCWGPRGR
jgi:hypothetical protein